MVKAELKRGTKRNNSKEEKEGRKKGKVSLFS